ncbi:MAG TPA: hypothetical protein EYG85_02145 [Crocinitomix sp.]|nr:hypothetical protein [Crocinitomix sp.]
MTHLFKIISIFFISFNCFTQSNSETIKNSFKTAIINQDISQQKKLSKKIITLYSTNTLFYYQLLLNTTAKNAIIITNGIDDTYPLIALQQTKNINPYTKIISLSLLKNKTYLAYIQSEFSIKLSEDETYNIKQFLKYKAQNVYVSTTVNPKYYKSFSSTLFLNGLTLNKSSSQQINKLNNVWIKIKNIIYKINLSDNEKLLYQNFLPPLLTLYKLNLENQQFDNSSLKKDILELANKVNNTQNNMKQKVKQILIRYDR